MLNHIATVVVLVMLLGTGQAPAQDADARAAHVTVGSVIPQVHVSIQLHAGVSDMYVPICGETDFGTPLLCSLGARLEVLDRDGWRAVRLRKTYGVLGAAALGRAGGKTIAAGNKGSFSFQFSRRYFEVESGDRLRLVVDAWPNEQSMKAGARPAQIISPEFECPALGTGQ